MRWLALLVLLVPCTQSVGQSSTFDLLKTGVNAEAGAMGDAHVATVDDAYAVFWNPAGLASTSTNSAVAAHHIWVGTYRTYALAAQVTVADQTAAGIFVLANDIGFSNRVGGTSIGEGVQSLVTGVSVGRAIGPVRVGGTVKYVSERILQTPSRGVAADFGLQFSAKNESFRAGVSLLNLGQMSDVAGLVTEIPTTVRAGLAVYPFRVISFDDAGELLNAHVIVEVSRILPDELTRFHVGVAARVLDMVTARAGYITNDELRSLTAGLGLDVEPFRFDYALVPFSQGFGGPGHQLSMVFSW